MADRVIRGGTLVLPDGARQLDLAIEDGRISEIGREPPTGSSIETDARGLHIFPAVIDVHLHFNEPDARNGKARPAEAVRSRPAAEPSSSTCR